MNTPLRTPFGSTPSGEQAERITLNNGTLSCGIITYGAILQSLSVPDQNGNAVDVVLGFDTLEGYLADTEYIGSTVGRFANRVAGGRFCLDGKEYPLATNNGTNHLHGGINGYSHRVWSVEDSSPTHVTLKLFSPDGEEGYPGSLTVRVTYRLEAAALVIHYQAETDQATSCNLTNHSYFNLDGHRSAGIAAHQVTLQASYYTPADADCMVLGTLEPVDGTPMDLRSPAAIGSRIGENFAQLKAAGGYDHNFAIDGSDGTLRPAAQVFSPASGITMTVETTQPGIQFYTANGFPVCRGKGGAEYLPWGSFCLETQGFPDAPNRPNFPDSVLRPGERYDHTTVFRFS